MESNDQRSEDALRLYGRDEFYFATGEIRATQQLLGHEDISTTADVYVRPRREPRTEAPGRVRAERGLLIRARSTVHSG